MEQELYISTDIEADGKIPGESSMLSLASAVYTQDKQLIDTFSVNLKELPGAKPHPETMQWWKDYPQAWEACRQDQLEPAIAMKQYSSWLKTLHGELVFVGYPAAFDFMWVYWYLMRFVGDSPFSFSALDIKTVAMMLLRQPYQKTTKSMMPKHWFDGLQHTHQALDDAIQQGAMFCNMLAEFKEKCP